MGLKSITKTTRKKKTRAPRIKVNKSAIPQWEGWEEWSGEQFHRHKRAASDWYYQSFKPADLQPHLFQWMLDGKEYTKNDVSALKALPGHRISSVICINAKLLLDGMPNYNKKEDEYWQSLAGTMGETKPVTEWMTKNIKILIEEGSSIVKEKKVEEKANANVYVPTIQERIRDQAYKQAEALEEWLEGWLVDPKSFDPKGFDFKKHFQEFGVTQAHARKLKGFYETALDDFKELDRYPTAGQLKKMDEHTQDMWAQLKEGYGHFKKADIKNYTIAIEELVVALDFVIDSAKVNRKPRKATPKSATKLVEKLKYCKSYDKYKVASILPDQIIKANELWVFNIKTRKLGKYVAKNIDPKGMGRDGTGLSVKGTTIIGFDETKSIQKTLRKPDDQIKEFKGLGKVKLRTFIEDIKTIDTKLNGRCNPDTLLLKAN
jgi:hypothetical protein